jgi:hypothetical protein
MASVALVAVLILVAAAMLAPGLVIGPSIDAAVFSDVGARVLHGVTPYVGVWDHKPPGIYLATAGAQAILGWLGQWDADWVLSLGASVGVGAATASVLARLGLTGWPRWLAAIGTTMLASHYLLALGGGLTEPPATAIGGLALVTALGQTTSTRTLVIGILAGLAVLLSVQLLPGALVVLALALLKRSAGERPRGAGLMALGFVAPFAAAAAWLVAIGAMPAAVDALVTYSAAYRASGEADGGKVASLVAAWTTLTSLVLVTPALLGAASLPRRAPKLQAVGIASLVWIGGTIVFVIVQRRFYAHYAVPLTVPLGILAGLGFERIGESLRHSRRPRQRLIIVVPLLISVVVSTSAGVVSAASEMLAIAYQNGRSRAVSRELRDLPAGTMLVWGNVPLLYTLADRLPATRYDYFFPLTTSGYSTPAQIQTVAAELAIHPPAVVVDAGSTAPGQPGFLPLLIDRPIAREGRDLDLLDPLRAFVAAHYRLAAIVSGWPIYVPRDAPP